MPKLIWSEKLVYQELQLLNRDLKLIPPTTTIPEQLIWASSQYKLV